MVSTASIELSTTEYRAITTAGQSVTFDLRGVPKAFMHIGETLPDPDTEDCFRLLERSLPAEISGLGTDDVVYLKAEDDETFADVIRG